MNLGTFRPAFLPDLTYFWQMAQCNVAVFTDHLPFSKGTSVNRSAVFPDAQTILRVPILHNKNRKRIFETEIDYHSGWAAKHLKTLHHFFHNLPFAYYYLPELEELFNTRFLSLGDFLFALQQKLVRWLYLPVRMFRASQSEFDFSAEDLIDLWANRTHCRTYMSQAETFEKGWVKPKALQEKGITPAIFTPIPNSHLLKNYRSAVILNFLLQFGPEAGFIIQQYLPPAKEA